jgi:hypothetical protein
VSETVSTVSAADLRIHRADVFVEVITAVIFEREKNVRLKLPASV